MNITTSRIFFIKIGVCVLFGVNMGGSRAGLCNSFLILRLGRAIIMVSLLESYSDKCEFPAFVLFCHLVDFPCANTPLYLEEVTYN